MVAGKATVTSPDALGSNGVIHAIDTVIVPPSMEKKLAKIMSKAAKKQKRLIGSNKDWFMNDTSVLLSHYFPNLNFDFSLQYTKHL